MHVKAIIHLLEPVAADVTMVNANEQELKSGSQERRVVQKFLMSRS
jgi:hypothetical protein